MFGAAKAMPRYWERGPKECNVGEFVSVGAPVMNTTRALAQATTCAFGVSMAWPSRPPR